MNRFAAVLLLASMAAGHVHAAPVTYTFSATGTPSGGPRGAGGPFVDPSLFSGLPVSGSFVYDNSALFFQTNPIGSSSYRGFTPQSVSGFVTALSSLSGQTGARTFADVAGSVEVGNDHSPGGAFDFLQYVFDPFTPDPSRQNLSSSGFNINGFSLVNIRFLFNEGLDTPDDFLSTQDLPAAPPAFPGRLVFDFAQPGETQASAFVFIGDLTITPLAAAVPEPEIYAMLASGFGLLGFVARRRRRSK